MPDTLSYLLMGLVAIFGISGLYVVSLIARHRSLEKDLQVIEKLKEDA